MEKLVRVQEGVIENNDQSGYQQYVTQRTLLNDVKTLKQQINILESRLAKLEEKVS